MTERQTTPPAAEPAPYAVVAEAGTRLEQLHAAYADAKAAADDAAAKLKAVTDALKVELTRAAPEGERKIELAGTAGPPLRLTWSESWRLDTKRIKAEHPEFWVAYAKKSGSWTLKAAPAGGESE